MIKTVQDMKKAQYTICIRMWAVMLLTMSLVACRSDDDIPAVASAVELGAIMQSGNNALTRAADVHDITIDEFPVPFYVEMEVESQNGGFGKYVVPSGYSGKLAADTGEPLNWQSPDANHTFYSWTLPWADETYTPGASTTSEIVFSEDDEMYSGVSVNNKNCAVLERFIGAKTGPVNYRNNGGYVELQFKHLVSKVVIEKITLISDKTNETTPRGGTWNNKLDGTFTFIGMPDRAVFDRKYSSLDHERPSETGPRVVANATGAKNEVSYRFNELNPTFYICPDVDFSNLRFRLNFDNPEYKREGGYHGDFRSVTFNLQDYEKGDGKGGTRTVLYAGEYISLSLTLTMGDAAVTDMTVTVKKWTDAPATGTGYPRKGIFNDGQAKEFVDAFNNKPRPDAATLDAMFEKYGTEEDGDKVFKLYEDYVRSGVNFPVPKGYVFDGMGHTITLNKATASTNPNRIGNCRDVFISDGEHLIYVDKDQNVYIVDENGAMTKTQEGPLPALGNSQYSFEIDFEKGTLTASTRNP